MNRQTAALGSPCPPWFPNKGSVGQAPPYPCWRGPAGPQGGRCQRLFDRVSLTVAGQWFTNDRIFRVCSLLLLT
jgi:hypothetical protein